MQPELVEFFIRFLTEEGDLVCDPFGGSNTTGAGAEALERRWIATEPRDDFIAVPMAASWRPSFVGLTG
jgi:site-specific DNA-methyltransferase (cytosine-N4-specific)